MKGMISSLRQNFESTASPDRATVMKTPAPPLQPARPTHLGKYLIVGELGRGGQGQVFRALHPTLGRDVAIKWSPRAMHDIDSDQDRLAAEGKLLAQLDHPGIVRIYDLEAYEGRPFLVMEYVRGRDLEQYAEHTSLPPALAAGLVAQVARAVAAAHRQGITHQDIKPGNILIDESGRPRLTDFGIARLQDLWSADQEQPQGGTLAYMAPEQLVGEEKKIGPAADIFGLGGVLFFLLTGQPPRLLPDNVALAYKQVAEGSIGGKRFHQPNVPSRLMAICRKSLAFDPGQRYATADAFAAGLEQFVNRPGRLRRRLAVAAGMLAVALCIWTVFALRKPASNASPVISARMNPFTVRVVRDGVQNVAQTQQEFEHILPLREKDELGFSGTVPEGIKVGLFTVNLNGIPKAKVLDLGPLQSEGQKFRLPTLVPLEKSPATELVFLVGDHGAIPLAEVIQSQLDLLDKASMQDANWKMPGNVLVAFDSQGVDEQNARGIVGKPKEDPVANVVMEAESIRKKLRARYPFVAGMAFTHVASEQAGDKRGAAAQTPGVPLVPGGKPASAEEKLFKEVVERLLATELVRKKYPTKFIFPPIYKVKLGVKETNAYAAASPKMGAELDARTGKIRPIIMATEPYMTSIIEGNPDILAAAMGHELAHVTLDHVSFSNRLDELLPSAFNRDEEIQADLEGIKYAVAAGYAYKGGVENAFKMQKRLGDRSSFEGLTGTHPSWNDRLALLDREHAQIWKSMAAFENGYIFLILEQYRTAEKCFERVTDDFPDCAEAWANLGYAQLMQYCDSLTAKDLAKLGIAQFVAGCFYDRPQNLAPVRSGDRALWEKAVKNLGTALKREPKLLLPQSNLGLAYLVHPDDEPMLDKAAGYFSKAIDGKNEDRGLFSLNAAAVMINGSVVDIAKGKLAQAKDLLQGARNMIRGAKSPLAGQLLAALEYNEAIILLSGDVNAKSQAVPKLYDYLLRVSPQSYWWKLALEKYTPLCKETNQVPASLDFLTQRSGSEKMRIVPSITLADKQLVTLSDDTEALLQKLNARGSRNIPIYYRSGIKRYNDVRPGIDILGGDQVLAIFLTSPQSPSVVIQEAGLGAAKTELRVGMSINDFTKAIKGQYMERTPRAVDNPSVQFSFLPDLGLLFRVRDGQIAELVVAQIPEKRP